MKPPRPLTGLSDLELRFLLRMHKELRERCRGRLRWADRRELRRIFDLMQRSAS
jgi:hypothetical protein